jgi:phage-related protein
MGKASLQSFALEQLMSLIEPFMKLLEPLAIIFEVISGLIEIMVGSALKPMMEAIQPLLDALIDMAPLFASIGTIIGELISLAIKPLVDIFLMFMPIIESILGVVMTLLNIALIPLKVIFGVISKVIQIFVPIFKIFADLLDALTPIFKIFGVILGAVFDIVGVLLEVALIPLTIIMELLADIIKPFIPFLKTFGEIIDELEPVIKIVSDVIKNIFIAGLYILARAIAFIIDVFTFGVFGAGAAVDAFFAKMSGEEEEKKTGFVITGSIEKSGLGSRTEGYIGFADGGIAVRPTAGVFGEDGAEALIPLNRMSEFTGDNEIHLLDIRDGINQLVQIQRKQSRGLQRRRLG